MSDELWRPVVGYEGLYLVSNYGRVQSLKKRTRTRGNGWQDRKQMMLSVYIDKTSTGYRCVSLSRDGKAKKANVHCLVLEAFVGPRPSPSHECCHGDGDRTNARLDNLRWDTAAANNADALRHGTRGLGEKAPGAVLTDELAQWILDSRQSSLQLAPILGVASSTIRAVRIGQNRSKITGRGMDKAHRRDLTEYYVEQTQALAREAGVFPCST